MALQLRTCTVALIGNPNTGKSTLFSGLVGVHQHVGNYPGVTVEKKTGQLELDGRRLEIVDLPGLYSLAARARDEIVVLDLLLGRRKEVAPVDAVVCIVDAGNLERNLYLVSQVLELELPTVLAVNMVDVADSRGIQLDLDRLERRLGIPVVAIQANRRVGLPKLKAVLAKLIEQRGGERASEREGDDLSRASRTTADESPPLPLSPSPPLTNSNSPTFQIAQFSTPLPAAFEAEAAALDAELAADAGASPGGRLPRWLVRRLLLDSGGYLQQILLDDADGRWAHQIGMARERLAAAGCATPAIETSARYGWAREILDGVVTQPKRYRTTITDRIDGVLTHRLWGTLVFAVVMLVVFQSVFIWARPAMEWIQSLTAAAGGWVSAGMAEGALRSLLVDGVIGGAGAVFAFLPQILILFAFLAVLEDCGYMARTAYLMDRLMVRVGLSGKSFIPLLSSFACAVPGVMATRVIENERDRLTTILVAPLLTCSARLPVYALLIAAIIPSYAWGVHVGTENFGLWLGLTLQGLTLAGLYVLGIVAAVGVALLLKRTILRGQTPPFVMELPSYKWPSPRVVFFRVADRGWVFLRCAGTLILAVSILVWAALYFPHNPDVSHQQQQRDSFLGQGGQVIEPAVKPLGWDWRIGCAVLASLPAREIVVATLGVMYHVDDEAGGDAEASSAELSEKLRSVTWDDTGRPVFTIPAALSIMVFFALCAQCAATLAVIRRETNSWRWPAFTFAYMTALAYVGALVTYQLGTWIGG
jgi:ferrous iron transport protein B